MANRFDVVINGISYRIRRGEDGTMGYRRLFRRRKIERQDTDTPGLYVSHPSRLPAYQTSWAQGSAWWKPNLADEPSAYYLSTGIDAWSKPGHLVPMSAPTEAQVTTLQAGSDIVSFKGVAYAVGNTTTVSSTVYDVYKWNPGSNAWGVSSIHSGFTTASAADHFRFASASKIYAMSVGATTNDTIKYMDPTAPTSGTAVIACPSVNVAGSNLMWHNGYLLYYNGQDLYQVTDPLGTPANSLLTSDALGLEALDQVAAYGANALMDKENIKLAVSTVDGLYYVKNVDLRGEPTPHVFRVERDSAGNWNSVPIATLPQGTLALDVTYHLGSLIISATDDVNLLLANDNTKGYPKVTFYHVTGGNLGTIGVLLGEDTDEMPFKLLGAAGPILYIGGSKRLWVYDAVRGGLHTAYDFATATGKNHRHAFAKVLDSNGDQNIMVWSTDQRLWRMPVDPATTNVTAVTTLGDDLSTYVLESNYFDFGIPMEDKTITGVHTLTDVIGGGAQWQVYLATDDAAFSLVASHTNQDDGHSLTSMTTAATGKRFRYKVVYNSTSATDDTPLRALMFEASSGRAISQWALTLDGTVFENVEGSPVRPEYVYDNLETLAQTQTPVTFTDRFRSERREDSTAYMVEVQDVQINKDQSGEAYIDVLLEEVYLGTYTVEGGGEV